MNKKVSVIIPVYNTGELAVGLVNEILVGNYNNLEVIVIDDGSEDDSLDILKTINDKKVRVLHQNNKGASAARNYGIGKARGEYLVFVDSDDEVKKDFLKKMVDGISNGVSLVSTGVEIRKVGQNVSSREYLDDFLYRKNELMETFVLRSLLKDGRMYPAFNKIFKASIVKENGLKFDERMKFGEDTKFVLDYLKKADGRIKFILEPLYIHNFGTATSTAKKTEGDWKNWQKCYTNLKKWVGRGSFYQKCLLKLIYLRWRVTWLRAKK